MKSRKDCGMPDLCSWDLEERLAVSYSVLAAITSPLKCHTNCTPLTNTELLAAFKADDIGTKVLSDNDLGLVCDDTEEDDFDGQEMICWTIDHARKETSAHNRIRYQILLLPVQRLPRRAVSPRCAFKDGDNMQKSPPTGTDDLPFSNKSSKPETFATPQKKAGKKRKMSQADNKSDQSTSDKENTPLKKSRKKDDNDKDDDDKFYSAPPSEAP